MCPYRKVLLVFSLRKKKDFAVEAFPSVGHIFFSKGNMENDQLELNRLPQCITAVM